MTVDKFVVFFIGVGKHHPLCWPTSAYPMDPKFDPGMIVEKITDASLFVSYKEACDKGSMHYNPQNFEVKKCTVQL